MTDLVEVRAKFSALRRLLAHEGWPYFKTFIEENIEGRRKLVIFTALGSMDEVLAQEFMKGEVAGQESMIAGIEARVDELEAWLKSQESKHGTEEEG